MKNIGLENGLRVAYFEYEFAKHGGAVGDILVYGDCIPKNAIITAGMIYVKTALTSGGLATIAVKAIGAADVLAATAVASWSLAAMLDVKPVGTAATAIKVTADVECLTLTIAVDTLLTGKAVIALEYLPAMIG